MAFQIAPMPDFNVKIPDVIGGQEKAATLAALLNENRLRQQLAPLQVQEQQEKTQQATIATQTQQQELDSRKAMMAAIASGELDKYAGVQTPDGSGFDAGGAYQHLISKGVLPAQAGEYANSWLTIGKNQAEISKNLGEAGRAQQEIREKTLKQVANKLGDIGDMTINKASNALDAFRQDLVRNPKAYTGLTQQEMAELYSADLTHLDALEGHLGIAAQVADFHKSQAEAATAEAASGQKIRAAAAPTPWQLTNAVTTLNTYNAVPPNMRAGLANEMKAAPDWETLQKVQTRADAANEAFQRSADARQQAMAMRDVGLQNLVAGKLVAEDEKLGTTLDNSKGIRDLLTQNLEGNQTALAAAQVRFAGHEIKEGGINRITQTEINSQTKGVGSFARQLQTWADKGFQGKAPVAGVDEMRAILDMEDKAATDAHQRNVDIITNRYAKSGAQPNAPAAKPNGGGGASASGPPFGATHTVLNRADGKMHWTDARNSRDYGVAQ
jgi:hypothetical protein